MLDNPWSIPERNQLNELLRGYGFTFSGWVYTDKRDCWEAEATYGFASVTMMAWRFQFKDPLVQVCVYSEDGYPLLVISWNEDSGEWVCSKQAIAYLITPR